VTDEATTDPGSAPSLVTKPFVSLAAAALAFYIASGVILPITPRFVEDRLAGGPFEVGIVFASFAIASLALRPLVGWSSDRFGRRPLLVAGALLTVVGMLVHLAAGDIVTLVAGRSLLGAGEAFFLIAALAAASDLAPPSRRGEALSLVSLSLYLGIAIGPLLGESLLGDGDYGLVWAATAGVAGLAVVLSLLVPETAPMVVAHTVARVRPPLIHRAGLFPGLIILTGMWGMAGFFTFLPAYVTEVGLAGASLPLLVYALIVVGLRIVGATVPDRYGAARVASAALAVAACGLAVIGLVPTPFGLLVGTAVFASGVAFIMPALVSLAVSSVPPGERGTVVGTTAVFLDVAFGLAPVALGVIAARSGVDATFLVSATIAGIGASVLFGRRTSVGRDIAVGS
jgi:MFS family permease